LKFAKIANNWLHGGYMKFLETQNGKTIQK
jgi:hypothetical protein